jgi:drug/metabolite transporter (DMT)-like permease
MVSATADEEFFLGFLSNPPKNRLFIDFVGRSKEPERRTSISSGLIYGILATLGWGVGLAAAHHGFVTGFAPLDLLFIRFAVATPVLLAVFGVTRGWKRITETKAAVAVVLALVGGPVLTIRVTIGGRKAPFASGVLLEVSSLAVFSILLARLVLGERLSILRTIASLALTLRLAFLVSASLSPENPDVLEGMLLFGVTGLASATFAALSCKWRVDPVAAMTIVSVASLAVLGGYYLFAYGISRLSFLPWPYVLEQIVAQGLAAGFLSWIGFLYAARILGLVTASFMPAMTPAVASAIALYVSNESPTAPQWLLIVLGTVGAGLLMATLNARSKASTRN